jgi:hypothetical protein
MIAEAEVGRKQDAELGTYSPRPRNLVRADGEGEGEGSSSDSENSIPSSGSGLRSILDSQLKNEVMESQYSPRPGEDLR